MTNCDDLLFASIDIPILDCSQASKEILKIDNSFFYWDVYRNMKILPLMTKSGLLGAEGTKISNNGDFLWAFYTPKIIVDWFENFVFPWTKQKSRVVALFTPPGTSNHEHIDASFNELEIRQHKFRYVIQGNTNTLYFKTSNGDVYVPNIKSAFIMDGRWPHGMSNTDKEVKITLALGAPWMGHSTYSNVNILLNRKDFKMPSDLSKFWNKYY